jgi:hypothetical protein
MRGYRRLAGECTRCFPRPVAGQELRQDAGENRKVSATVDDFARELAAECRQKRLTIMVVKGTQVMSRR